MKLSDALAKMNAAQLRADHMPNTRQSYQAVIVDYAALLKSGVIDGPQAYLDHLADTRKLHWQTIRKALSPLHFFHVHVLEKEMGQLKLPPPRKTRRMPAELTHADCMNIIAALDRAPKL